MSMKRMAKMERLTEKITNKHTGEVLAYRAKCHRDLKAVQKLGWLEDLEEQGRLLEIPIIPETPIYSIEYCCGKNKDNKSGICYKGFCKDCENRSHYILEETAESCCKICEIGKTVFFIEEEAEAALKEFEGHRND